MRRLCLLSFGALSLSACVDHAKPAVALYDNGDYAGAARAADEGLATHPDDDELWGMRIRAALALGDADGVAKAYAAYDEPPRRPRQGAAARPRDRDARPGARVAVARSSRSPRSTRSRRSSSRRSPTRSPSAWATTTIASRPPRRSRSCTAYPQGRRRSRPTRAQVRGRRGAADRGRRHRQEGRQARARRSREGRRDDDAARARAAIRWLGALKDEDAVEVLTQAAPRSRRRRARGDRARARADRHRRTSRRSARRRSPTSRSRSAAPASSCSSRRIATTSSSCSPTIPTR